MKKIILLLIGFLLVGSMFVVAEENLYKVTKSDVNYKPIEPKPFDLLEWWNSLFGRKAFEPDIPFDSFEYGERHRSSIKFKDVTTIKYGAKCGVGEYINLVTCVYPETGCQKIFQDYYKKEFNDDNLDISKECVATPSDGITNCRQREWFTSFVNEKYVGYDCLIPVVDIIKRGSYSFEAVNTNERTQIKDFLGISPAGDDIDTYLSKRSDSELISWKSYWLNTFNGFYDETDLDNFVVQKYNEYYGEEPVIIPKYKCDANNNCVRDDTNGIYTSSDCNGKCISTIKKYRCVSGVCKEDSTGTYTEPTCAGECAITPPSDADAPTIENIQLLANLETIKDGGEIPLKVTIRTPLGFHSNDYPASLGAKKDGAEYFLKMEAGIYDRDWAEKQGWIGTINWWERAWSVYKLPEPCREEEKGFVQTYRFYTSGILAWEWCNVNSDNYDSSRGACFQTFEKDNKGNKIIARVPESFSTLWDGTKNYNEEGKYLMILGLYYDCGKYLPNPESVYKVEVNLGPIPTYAPGTSCNEGDKVTKTCSDGSKLIKQECVEKDGKLVWSKVYDVECPTDFETKQLSLTKSEWKTATPKMIIQAMCDYAYQCTELEGFEVDCEYSLEIEARNKDAYEKETGFFEDFWKTTIFQFGGEELYGSGTCRATPVSEFDYCKYTEPLAFFSITDDKCNDGAIMIGIIILLIIFLPKLIGGKK